MYIESSSIEVFPSTRRANRQLSARLLSEASIVGLTNKLVDTDGFIITRTDAQGTIPSNQPFEFCIYGYYFKVASATLITQDFSNATTIYANIYLDTVDDYIELQGQDRAVNNIDQYEGVTFSDTDLTQDGSAPADYSLLIFSRESSSASWQIPISSKAKFDSGFSISVATVVEQGNDNPVTSNAVYEYIEGAINSEY